MGRRRRLPGVSFSLSRAVGLDVAKRRIAKATGMPLTRGGRQRKAGAAIGCALFIAVPLVGLAVASALMIPAAAEPASPSAAVYLIDYSPNDHVLFLGQGQATRTGDIVNVPSAIVFAEPRQVEAGAGSTFITVFDFDCAKRRMREASGSVLTGEGFVIDSWSLPEPWRPVGEWTDEAISNEQVMFMVSCEEDTSAAGPVPGMRDISQATENYLTNPR